MIIDTFISSLGLSKPFFAGVPDSQLKPFCNYLAQEYGINENHIIAANEGNAVALAAGHYLATGDIPVVYLQNSGLGNAVNPITSLLNDKVYGIPTIFIIGWRGEPGLKDEPQHVFQGEISKELCELLNLEVMVLDKETTAAEVADKVKNFQGQFNQGKSLAFLVKKGAFEDTVKANYQNNYELVREDIVEKVVEVADEDIIVSTTGKASRELFEIREAKKQSHKYDFLTVGSMGHSSSIALAIAQNKKDTKVWCIDGDGAALMHLGAFALTGSSKPNNLVHILIDNSAHETVGGMPTVSEDIDFVKIAKACGYPSATSVTSIEELEKALKEAKTLNELTLIEVKASLASRADLGRPTTTAKENKEAFMDNLKKLS
ncbi:MAG: phosphonopyruvate decarboxylase [Micrococcaceae bacterium]